MRREGVYRFAGWVFAWSFVVAGALGCHVDREAFFKRVFTCNVADVDPGCATDIDGHPMSCYPGGGQLGSSDFCARTCDDGDTLPDDVCLPIPKGAASKERLALHKCTPSQDTAEDRHGACHQGTLACLSTDLRAGKDEGLCTTMTSCSVDTDCRDPVRPVCASTFLQTSLYKFAEERVNLTHLFCLQVDCDKNETACSPGESCLRRAIGTAANPPDICVPNCDSNHRCPPNFLCYQGVSTAIAPNVCIPGILGFTCSNEVDCLLGDCVDTGIGYPVCATKCAEDSDCTPFDGPQGNFVCAKGDTPVAGTCQTPDAYRGSICKTDEHCSRNSEEKCTFFDASSDTGTCLLPCGLDGSCPTRGGIGHGCIPGLNACFPGYQQIPCQTDANCVGDLKCMPVGATLSVCSKPCEADTDCTGRWVSATSWCETRAHACLKKMAAGETGCPADNACLSGHCQITRDPDGGVTESKCL